MEMGFSTSSISIMTARNQWLVNTHPGEGTAYPKNKLRAVMIKEVMRRLRNSSSEMIWEEKGMFLSELAREMMNSGHNETFRKEIMERSVIK